MKISVKLDMVQKVKIKYPSFDIDTAEYPELEGKTLDQIRFYIEKHAHQMHSTEDKYDSLQEQMAAGARTVVLKKYLDESEFYITSDDEDVIESFDQSVVA